MLTGTTVIQLNWQVMSILDADRYHCHTCKMVDGVGVCTVCAKVCHKDHDLSYAKFGSFFCDCGAKEDGSCKVRLLCWMCACVCACLCGCL